MSAYRVGEVSGGFRRFDEGLGLASAFNLPV